ncbi:MAG: hypothetical protein ACFB5Z_16215 [Elainellaceae cyanobacterium]
MAVDRAGHNRKTAKRLGRLAGGRQIQARLGGGDRVDLYAFRLGHSSRVNLRLSRFRANADLSLLDGQGQTIKRSQRPGRRSEKIQAVLEAGRYFVRAWTRGSTVRDRPVRNRPMPYRLQLRARGLPAVPEVSAPGLALPVPPTSSVPGTATPSAPAPSTTTPSTTTPIPASAPVIPPSRPLPPGLTPDPTPPAPPKLVTDPVRPDLVRYDFEYHYGRSATGRAAGQTIGDRYRGYVVAQAGTHALGWYDVNPAVNELGFNGQYLITAVSDDDDARPQDAGLVFVTGYTDVNAGSQKGYEPYFYGQGLPSGRGGLGSELDFIDLFGSSQSGPGQSGPGQSHLDQAYLNQPKALQRRFGEDRYASDPALVRISDLSFSGLEGDMGRFRLRLTRQPRSAVTVTFGGGKLTVDADGQIHNGTQDTLTFTRSNWNQPQTAAFVAELDGTSEDRPSGEISYSLSGGLTGGSTHDVGPIHNTYASDPRAYNIDFDFRADHLNFWTPARRRVLQRAADDWASRIATDFSSFQFNDVVSLRHPTQDAPSGEITLASNRYVDDLVIFAAAYDADDGAGAWAGVQTEGPGPANDLPRVSMLTVNQRYAADYSEADLYWLTSHEIGHGLGLIRQSRAGRALLDSSSPETAVFRGKHAREAHGGNVPLQSQDGPNPITGRYDYGHPADSVDSILGYTQRASRPTAVDYAMLADIGYSVYGVNAARNGPQEVAKRLG